MIHIHQFSAEMFQKLSKVLTVLTDTVARASYDRWLRAKHAARRRHEELNSKRRRLKEELEQREGRQTVSEVATEREAAASMQKEVCPPLHLPAHLTLYNIETHSEWGVYKSSGSAVSLSLQIERLREESQRRIQEQAELLRQQMARGGQPLRHH